MRVILAGASGLIGTALVAHLTSRGHACLRLVRESPGGSEPATRTWHPERGGLDPAVLDGVDAVVNLAGSPVSQRWTAQGRAAILTSRLQATSTIAEAMASHGGPRILIQASAIGFYGDRGEEALDEDSGPGTGFLSGVVQAWEGAADPAREAGIRVTCARTGIVLARDGGALARLLPLIRLGLGGPLGSGRQWWSWISLADEVAALGHLLEDGPAGPVNLTAPHPARQRDVVAAIARRCQRPAVLPVPGFALRLVIGGFAGEILASQRVLPTRLIASGYRFGDETIETAARALI